MRLCMANGKKAIFHRWDQVSELVAPSPMRGGHSGGIIRYTVGVVEYEDGAVASVPEKCVVFLDTDKLMEKLDKEHTKWMARGKAPEGADIPMEVNGISKVGGVPMEGNGLSKAGGVPMGGRGVSESGGTTNGNVIPVSKGLPERIILREHKPLG